MEVLGRRRTGTSGRRTAAGARARTVEEYLEADRRFQGERLAEHLRWLFLGVLWIVNYASGAPTSGGVPMVNLLLGVWGVANLAITVMLGRGHRPGRRFGLGTLAMDLLIGALLVYYSDGFASPFFLAFFLAVLVSSVRFGLPASLGCAATTAFIYMFVGGSAPLGEYVSHPQLGREALGKVFLFFVVALVASLAARELVRERAAGIGHSVDAHVLRELAARLAGGIDLREVLVAILKEATELSGARAGTIHLVTPHGLELASRLGEPSEIDQPLEPDARVSAPGLDRSRTRISAPIGGSGRQLAVLTLGSPVTPFGGEDLYLAAALSRLAAEPIQRALLYQRVYGEGSVDNLTGAASQDEFKRGLARAFARRVSTGEPVSLLLADIDHMAAINHARGQLQGDEVLRRAAALIQSTVRAGDLVARLGGDQFAILLDGASREVAVELANRLVGAFRFARIAAAAEDAWVSISIGVSGHPEDGEEP